MTKFAVGLATILLIATSLGWIAGGIALTMWFCVFGVVDTLREQSATTRVLRVIVYGGFIAALGPWAYVKYAIYDGHFPGTPRAVPIVRAAYIGNEICPTFASASTDAPRRERVVVLEYVRISQETDEWVEIVRNNKRSWVRKECLASGELARQLRMN